MEVSFTSGSTPSMDVILFNASPTASTITDHANLAVANADVGKIAGVLHISDCTLAGTTAPAVCQVGQQAVPFNLPAGQTLYAAVVTRSSITLTSTTDMSATIQALQN